MARLSALSKQQFITPQSLLSTYRLLYEEAGILYISRRVVEVMFLHFAGVQQASKWDDTQMLCRFKAFLKVCDESVSTGMFAPIIDTTKQFLPDKIQLTDIPVPTIEEIAKLQKVVDDAAIKSAKSQQFVDDAFDYEEEEDIMYSAPSDANPHHVKKKSRYNSKSKGIRRPRFTFGDFSIPIGTELSLIKDPCHTVKVVSEDFEVEYTGSDTIPLPQGFSFSHLTRFLLGKQGTVSLSPVDYWKLGDTSLRVLYNKKYGNRRKQLRESKKLNQ